MQLGYMLVPLIYAPALRSEQHEVDDIAARRKLVKPLFERLFRRSSARCNARDLFDTGSTQLSPAPFAVHDAS